MSSQRASSSRSESAEPRGDLRVFRTSLDRWMGRLRDEPAAFPSLSDIGWVPSTDVQENDDEVTLTLIVDEHDMGRVIGRDGRIANAIRSLLRVMGARDGRHVELDIVAHE